jgi:hypothetical protein
MARGSKASDRIVTNMRLATHCTLAARVAKEVPKLTVLCWFEMKGRSNAESSLCLQDKVCIYWAKTIDEGMILY